MSKNSKIALVGSPNVGKSVIFGALTGSYVTVSNYPGTTVELASGKATIEGKAFEVMDTPGLYSIFPITEEEKVTLEVIKNGGLDLIIHVIDAKNLERMLPLTFQLREVGLPIVVALNMFDEATSLNMTIDTGKLSSRIGVPVVATVAVTGQGISRLGDVILQAVTSTTSPDRKISFPEFSERLMKGWHDRAKEIMHTVVIKKERKRGLSKIDKIIISPISGTLILALILYLGLYKFVGVLGAGVIVDIMEGSFKEYVNPLFTGLANHYIPWQSVRDLFVGDYGIISLAFRYAIAIILPVVGLFFLVFATIEDSGYLPRLGYLLDRLFKKIGLSGRAIIPMVLGLGCDTMATVVTRTLPTKRERLIATLLLSLCIPCSAQVGVILGLLSGTPAILLTWVVIIVMIFAVVGYLSSKIIPGGGPSFIMEIPPLRFPSAKNVIMKTYSRMVWYFKEIIPLFVLASVLIWLGQISGVFELAIKGLSYPLSLMDLPDVSAPAFFFGFFRRDYGVAGLYDLHQGGLFTNNQLLVAVVVMTLFLPCITQFLITLKERGWKAGFGISLFVLAFAFATGVALNAALNFLGISF